MRVLAIDPGYDRLGIAVVEGDASKPTLVWSDCFIPTKGSSSVRLGQIARILAETIREYTPDAVALETLFFSTNVKTAIGVAEARGVVLAAAGTAALPVIESSPQGVKLAVTGYGNADKKAVTNMVPKLITIPPKPGRLDDEYDAIALGIAALTLGKRV